MATITWTGGANDGNWATAGNWSGGVPASTDDVIIADGAQSITNGLNQSAVTLASLTVSAGYRGSIGSSSAPLQINVSGTLSYAGSGDYAKISGTIATANIDRTGGGVFYVSGGTWTTITSSGGLCFADGSAVITTLNNAGATWPEIPWNATAITTLNNEAGTIVSCQRSVTTLVNNAGATATIQRVGTNAPASTTVSNRGTLRWYSSGTVTTGNNFPRATWDNTSAPYSYAITTMNDWAGGSFNPYFQAGTSVPGTWNRIGRVQGPVLPMV